MSSVVCTSHYSNSWVKQITDLEKISRIDKMIDALFLVSAFFSPLFSYSLKICLEAA